MTNMEKKIQNAKNYDNWVEALDLITEDFANLVYKTGWLYKLVMKTIKESDDDEYKDIISQPHIFGYGDGDDEGHYYNYDEYLHLDESDEDEIDDEDSYHSCDYQIRLGTEKDYEEEGEIYDIEDNSFDVKFIKYQMPIKTKKEWYEEFKKEARRCATTGLGIKFSENQKKQWNLV